MTRFGLVRIQFLAGKAMPSTGFVYTLEKFKRKTSECLNLKLFGCKMPVIFHTMFLFSFIIKPEGKAT